MDDIIPPFFREKGNLVFFSKDSHRSTLELCKKRRNYSHDIFATEGGRKEDCDGVGGGWPSLTDEGGVGIRSLREFKRDSGVAGNRNLLLPPLPILKSFSTLPRRC